MNKYFEFYNFCNGDDPNAIADSISNMVNKAITACGNEFFTMVVFSEHYNESAFVVSNETKYRNEDNLLDRIEEELKANYGCVNIGE